MAMGRRALLLLAPIALMLAAPAHGSSVRVPADYYGVNFQRIAGLGAAARDQHLSRIASLRITQVRFNVSWAAIEPLAPENGVHTYRWGAIDEQVAAMARRGIRGQPVITQSPSWNAASDTWTNLQCDQAASRAPLQIAPYIAFAQMFAKRYGKGGVFWQSNPGVPYRPVVRYEIWNEPNLKGGWCPQPQPWLYADMFVGASQAIRAVDRRAEVITGGVAPPSAKNENNRQYVGVADFLTGVTARQPNLGRFAKAVAVHIYPATDPYKQLARIAWFRSQVHDGGISNSIPMLVNEIGWATHVGKVPLTESDRAEAYRPMTVNYARTNCNVIGVLPHTWISPQRSNKNPEDWYGIAGPATAKPYDSALAYSHGVRLMRGELATEAPRNSLMVCPGMPLPDRDRDGYPDQDDYYPMDATRH
jgi:hypothetical protein